MRLAAPLLAALLLLGPASASAQSTDAASGSLQAENLKTAGGLLTTAGWAGIAIGTGFMIADHSASDSPFGPQEDDEIVPRGPIIIAASSVCLVVGLSIALPPLIDGVDVAVAPAGPGLVVHGRF